MAMTRKGRRLTLIATAGAILAVAVGLILFALQDRIVFFNTPSELQAGTRDPDQVIRLGGMVAAGSVTKAADGLVNFAVTDGSATVSVSFRGVLPDLFREGQGVVAEGHLGTNGTFVAATVLAKHDETYMPRELVDDLKEKGVWQHDGTVGQ